MNKIEKYPAKILRVAVVGTRGIPATYSGIERACEELYPRIADRGHKINIFVRKEFSAPDIKEYKGVNLIYSPAINLKSLYTISHCISSICKILMVKNYDIIHFHALAPGLVANFRPLLQIPIISTIHGLDWGRAKWNSLGKIVLKYAEKKIVEHADEIIVVSKELKNYYKQKYGRLTHYIPNGAPVSQKPNDDGGKTLSRFGLISGDYILWVGRIVPEKRVEDLIQAFNELETNKKLAIVGGSSFTDSYVSMLNEKASGNSRIVFLGVQTGEILYRVYGGAYCFVTTSELEGLPLALLEAVEFGIPVLASDIPPHREIFEGCNDFDGFFSVKSISQLKIKIQKALVEKKKVCQSAEKVRQHILKTYNWDDSAQQTLEIYHEVVKKAT